MLIHLSVFLIFFIFDIPYRGNLNLFFIAWLVLIPYFNYRHKIRTAVVWGNLMFAPMVIALGYTYSGAQYIEDFLFIGLALTFFSFKKKKLLLMFSMAGFAKAPSKV